MNVKKIICLILISAWIVIFCGGFIEPEEKSFIRWVDNRIPYEVLMSAYEYQVEYHDSETVEYDFSKALAYLAFKNGNSFSVKKDIKELSDLVNMLKAGKKIDDFYGANKYYKYYNEAYDAIFAEFIGEYTLPDGKTAYGLKNYHPFPKGYWYSHGDDFGNSRSYGFKRKHLGHDLMGSVGTPIIAIEGGVVTEFGWNKYGGWRIGIRSHDKKRSYYYAHLRRNKPYAAGLQKGSTIQAGQVIGYLGVTGYSTRENNNMTGAPHLHLGMQLIFDECQYQGPKEIWIDMYNITKFLSHNRATVYKEDGEYYNARLRPPTPDNPPSS